MNEYIVESLENRMAKIIAYSSEIREFSKLNFEDSEIRNAFYKQGCMSENLISDIYDLFKTIGDLLWSIEND